MLDGNGEMGSLARDPSAQKGLWEKDVIWSSVTIGSNTFRCLFKMTLHDKVVDLKRSYVSCYPKMPRIKKINKLKLTGKLGSYTVSLTINPNNIREAGKTSVDMPCLY